MRTYTRAHIPGGCFFFTVNLADRRENDLLVRQIANLREAFRRTRAEHPFAIYGIVIQPDHLHCIWRLPEGDSDFPMRWRLIKTRFSHMLGSGGGGVVGRYRHSDLPFRPQSGHPGVGMTDRNTYRSRTITKGKPMNSLLRFDDMITPKIITFVYWLILAGIVLACLVAIVGAFSTMLSSVAAGLGTLVVISIAAVLAALLARVYCEILIVIFKINENLQHLRDK
jgi:REP element-mobilizing transposase RayT